MSWNLVLESLSQPVINRYEIVFFTLLGSESCAQGAASAAWHQTHPYYSRLAISGGICMSRTSVWLQIIEPVMLIMLFGLLSWWMSGK